VRSLIGALVSLVYSPDINLFVLPAGIPLGYALAMNARAACSIVCLAAGWPGSVPGGDASVVCGSGAAVVGSWPSCASGSSQIFSRSLREISISGAEGVVQNVAPPRILRGRHRTPLHGTTTHSGPRR
jgi:hypothetical protein